MCEWRSALNPDYHCRVSPEPGSDYCIFHEPGEKDIGRFKQKFYEQIDGDRPEEARNLRHDFRGYFFPTGILASAGSREAGQLILPKEIAGDLIGSEATIKGNADFGGVRLRRTVYFGGASIGGKTEFALCQAGLFHWVIAGLRSAYGGEKDAVELDCMTLRQADHSGALPA
jgi:hypothetical protein